VATYPNAGTANDGKVVLVGDNITSRGYAGDLVRYNVNGTLDASFAGSGVVTNTPQSMIDAAVQPNGKIVAAGTKTSGSNDFALVRYNADGSLDKTFGGGKGEVTTDIGNKSNDVAVRIALQADGKIVVAGATAPNGVSTTTTDDLALVRYNPDGSLDTTFGTGGKVTLHFAQPFDSGAQKNIWLDAHAMDMALDPTTGKIVVVGGPGVTRFNTNGTLDTSFGGGTGYVSLPGYCPPVAVQPDSRIVVGGPNGSGLYRLNADGTPDVAFGAGGFAALPAGVQGGYGALTVQADGKLLWATRDNHSDTYTGKLVVARYNANGALDASFGTNGIATGLNIFNSTVAVALEPDGRVVAAGTGFDVNTGVYSFGLARFLAGPEIDTFTASASAVTSGGSLTLSASNLTDGDPSTANPSQYATVTQVAFYAVDSTGNQYLLGYGTTSGGTWSLSCSVSLPAGTYTLYAEATDSDGIVGDSPFLGLTVN
jgi:uncharacterized delta-60 repeat protein